MFRHTLAAALAATTWTTLTPAVGAATFEGFPITLEALPAEVRQPIPITITTDQFKARLKQGGTVQLIGNETIIAPLNPKEKTLAFLALDVLELKQGARIVTNGNALVIFANKIISENGEILSFRDADRMAPPAATPPEEPGSAGNPGNPGGSGGIVTIHVMDKIEGILNVNLRGQAGSKGGDGRQGGKGTRGGRGQDAVDDIVIGAFGVGLGSCRSGGVNGSIGNLGFPGGSSGAGAAGGDGGFFQLINVGPTPLPQASFTFKADGGEPGAHGEPGTGGPGGDGGEGGSGSIYCSGGHGGPIGPQGQSGTKLTTPVNPGAPGRSLVRNLDLEVVVRTAVNPINAVVLPPN